MAQVYRYSMKGKLRRAAPLLAIAVALLVVLALYGRFGSWSFFVVAMLSGFLFVRSALYLFGGGAELHISEEGISRHGIGILFASAKVTLRTAKEKDAEVIQDVLIEGPPLPTGTVPSVVFDRSLENFLDAVRAVLVHIPDKQVTVLSRGAPAFSEEEKLAVLAPFRGSAVERALAQLGKPTITVPPNLRN